MAVMLGATKLNYLLDCNLLITFHIGQLDILLSSFTQDGPQVGGILAHYIVILFRHVQLNYLEDIVHAWNLMI